MNVANNHNLKNSLLNVSFYQETTKSILLKPPLRQIVSFSHIKKKTLLHKTHNSINTPNLPQVIHTFSSDLFVQSISNVFNTL